MKNKSRQLILSIAGRREHAGLTEMTPLLEALFSALEHRFTANGESFTLNVQTGLADGADMAAAEASIQWEHNDNTKVTLTGIFPFQKDEYLQTIEDSEKFIKIHDACNSIVILDGRYLPGDESLSKECRDRAYRQQGQYLLQACDVLVAIADEREVGKAGGTIETAGLALKKEIPVIFISLKHFCFFWLSKPAELEELISKENSTLIKQPAELSEIIFKLIWTGDLEL